MSFYGTPLKHGKGVNKPFRSPFLKNNQNEEQGNGTPTSRKLNTSLKSLGLKTPIYSRGFVSPLRPLELNSPTKSLEISTVSKSLGFSSPLKRMKCSSPLKQLEPNSFLVRLEKNESSKPLENNSTLKSSENNLSENLHINSSVKLSEEISEPKRLEKSSLKIIEADSTIDEKISKPEIILPSNHLALKTKDEKYTPKSGFLTTPPSSPMSYQTIKSPEYQPVVKLQRLSPEIQNIAHISKKDLDLIMKRISEKQKLMVVLRATMPTNRKHNLEEIVASIGKWRNAFIEALETLRESLTEKNGRPFSTSDVLKLLSIPNSIVHFSEEENDFIFPKL